MVAVANRASLIFVGLLFILTSLFSVSVNTRAADTLEEICKDPKAANSNLCLGYKKGKVEDPVIKTITIVIEIMSYVAGILAVLYVMYGGFKYITSSGAPDKAASARKTIIFALIGIVIIFLSRTLILWLLNWLS